MYLLFRNASNARIAPAALLAWAGGPARSVRREYTRRPPIDNLQRGGEDLEHRRRRSGELPVGLHPDRLVAFDLDASGFTEFDLGQPAVRSAIEHRQAADPQPAAD